MSDSDAGLISAGEALVLLREVRTVRALDVRSEGEFLQSSIRGFVNHPILTNSERHQVGLTYKREGQTPAVRLGYDLVGPLKVARVESWLRALGDERSTPGLVACWRGGMRSQIACAWLLEAGRETLRVRGGYKALRGQLLAMLNFAPPLQVLSGMTGSGKTELLHRVQVPKVDLEGLAQHRGSSFGRRLDNQQPTQATFENALALELAKPGSPLLIEDESSFIGSLRLPIALKAVMNRAPVVLLESTDDERLLRLHREYVCVPMLEAGGPERVVHGLLESLERIRPKLGGQEADQIRTAIESAFARPEAELLADPEPHRRWIVGLLHSYYDKLYRYSFIQQQNERHVSFRGGFEECRQWIESQRV